MRPAFRTLVSNSQPSLCGTTSLPSSTADFIRQIAVLNLRLCRLLNSSVEQCFGFFSIKHMLLRLDVISIRQ